jgi:hypothetical protein
MRILRPNLPIDESSNEEAEAIKQAILDSNDESVIDSIRKVSNFEIFELVSLVGHASLIHFFSTLTHLFFLSGRLEGLDKCLE